MNDKLKSELIIHQIFGELYKSDLKSVCVTKMDMVRKENPSTNLIGQLFNIYIQFNQSNNLND